ncbi:hypothetical protein BH09ACT8_BH09ACT8_08120 [soil metagenome]
MVPDPQLIADDTAEETVQLVITRDIPDVLAENEASKRAPDP